MSLTPLNLQQNHRGVAYSYVGDGATTTTTVPHARFVRTSMPVSKVFVTTGSTKFSTRSERGGMIAAEDGTPVTATASITGGNLTVTTNPAVGNGTTAYVVALHDNASA
jgi:hypothetical protein